MGLNFYLNFGLDEQIKGEEGLGARVRCCDTWTLPELSSAAARMREYWPLDWIRFSILMFFGGCARTFD